MHAQSLAKNEYLNSLVAFKIDFSFVLLFLIYLQNSIRFLLAQNFIFQNSLKGTFSKAKNFLKILSWALKKAWSLIKTGSFLWHCCVQIQTALIRLWLAMRTGVQRVRNARLLPLLRSSCTPNMLHFKLPSPTCGARVSHRPDAHLGADVSLPASS